MLRGSHLAIAKFAAVDVVFQAELAGPFAAKAGLLNTIATPIGGWSNVYNVLDAIQGADQESDFAFRARRDKGSSLSMHPQPSMPFSLACSRSMTQPTKSYLVTVFQNVTESTDVNGLPPHSVNVLVLGGTDLEVAQTIFNNLGAWHRQTLRRNNRHGAGCGRQRSNRKL